MRRSRYPRAALFGSYDDDQTSPSSARARWAPASPRCSRSPGSRSRCIDVVAGRRSIAPAPASRRASASSSRRASCRPPIATPRSAGSRRRPRSTPGRRRLRRRSDRRRRRGQARAVRAASTRSSGPRSILASNTSSISITVIGAATKRPDKVLGMHFMNPVPLMTLVELIRGQATSAESMHDRDGPVRRRSGKTPVEAADYPGFIANRILMPMINEAIFALMEGVGTRRGDRHRDEARDEPPDGTADARRLHRPRRLPRHPRTCCTTASAIRSTGRVRCCAAWSRPATSAARRAGASTCIPEESPRVSLRGANHVSAAGPRRTRSRSRCPIQNATRRGCGRGTRVAAASGD